MVFLNHEEVESMTTEALFLNHYHCSDCDVSWEDYWDCSCDDECPDCGIVYTPCETQEIVS